MSNVITLEVSGGLKLHEQLDYLKLPAAKRRQLHRTLGRQVVKQSRARIRAQKDLDGKSFSPRRGKSKKKMLQRIMRGSRVIVIPRDDNVKVTFRRNKTGQIARRHQEGIDEVMTADRLKKSRGKPDYSAPATRQQAIALREVGFTIKGKGKRRKKPSLKWIQENIKLGQAGLIISLMRKESKTASQWEIPTAKRAFLGMSAQEITEAARSSIERLTPPS